MSVIIRLQNLPWSANALDIRGYFRGLSIPDGGVHIVGGEMGDAFIAFSTDEDARQAMMMNGGKIKEVSVSTFLSSRAEMQKVIETARQTSVNYMTLAQPASTPIVQVPQPTPVQPQPPVISLSRFLSQKMSSSEIPGLNVNNSPTNMPNNTLQPSQPSVDFLNSYQSQSTPAFQSNITSSRFRNSNENSNDRDGYGKSDDSSRSRRDRDRKNRSSSSRSRSRERRRRDRSRSRDSRRRRDRSRSRDRRDRRDKRDRRSKSKERDRDRDRGRNSNRDDDRRQRDNSRDRFSSDRSVKKEPISVWEVPLQTVQPIIAPIQTNIEILKNTLPIQQMPNSFDEPHLNPMGMNMMGISPQLNAFNKPFLEMKKQEVGQPLGISPNIPNLFNRPPTQYSSEELTRLQELTNRRNPGAFQNDHQSNLSMGGGGNFSSTNSFNKNMGGNFNNDSRGNFNNNLRNDFNNQQQRNSNLNNSNDNDSNLYVYDDDDYDKNRLEPQSDLKNIFDFKPNNDSMSGLCVKLSNMDESTGYGDVRRFFQGLFIGKNSIKMINDDNGRRLGVALIQFSRNDSKCKAIFRNSYELKGQKVVVESISDKDFDDAIDSYRPTRRRFNDEDDDFNRERTYRERSPINQNQRGNFFQDRRNDNRGNDNNMDDNREDNEGNEDDVFTTIVLLDLPNFTQEQDIIKMFSDYSLMQIVMLRTDDWKKQYQAYVKFHRAQDAVAALKNKSKLYIGHRSIYATKCSDEDFEATRKKYSPDIPLSTGSEEAKSPENQSNNSASFQKSVGNQRGNFGFEKNRRNGSDSNNQSPQQRNEPNSNCIIMSNLNPVTTERDVLDFFSDVGVIPVKIHILTNKHKKPSGDCICEFPIVNDAVSAVTKDGNHFNKNRVTLNFIAKNRVNEILSVELLESDTDDDRKQHEQQRLKKIQEEKEKEEERKNKERVEKDRAEQEQKKIDEQKLKDVQENQKEVETKVVEEPKKDVDTREIRQEFQTSVKQDEKKPDGGEHVDEDDRDRPNQRPVYNNGNNMPNRMNMPPGRQFPPKMHFDNQNNMNHDTFNVPGCVIAMTNLPYRATTFDIQDFFRPFTIFEHHVMRRFNDRGQATGDARVCFPSQDDARRALQMVNNKSMHNRKVFASIM